MIAVEAAMLTVLGPAKNALLPTLVPKEQLVAANSLVGLNQNLGRLAARRRRGEDGPAARRPGDRRDRARPAAGHGAADPGAGDADRRRSGGVRAAVGRGVERPGGDLGAAGVRRAVHRRRRPGIAMLAGLVSLLQQETGAGSSGSSARATTAAAAPACSPTGSGSCRCSTCRPGSTSPPA
ncbi:hypothetical protein AB0H83_09500 [Dactylosporangium sp. NPDC050688]|uniref:hypothetical protein n=1 Tax=Dactylosporangium sp. NPDC050688 TaxID=3157217 RepID=UPI0033C20797